MKPFLKKISLEIHEIDTWNLNRVGHEPLTLSEVGLDHLHVAVRDLEHACRGSLAPELDLNNIELLCVKV
jgi:hypothetical protein